MKALSDLLITGAIILCGGIFLAEAVRWKPFGVATGIPSPTPCADSGSGARWTFQREPDEIPQYPNAQEVVVKNYTLEEASDRKLHLSGRLELVTREVSFLSGASAGEIQQFYERALQEADWMLDEKSEPHELGYFWIPTQPEGSCAPTPECCQPTFYVQLVIEPARAGMTRVDIRQAIRLGF